MDAETETEQSFEMLLSETGGLIVASRPPLPFAAEGVRIRDGRVELFGEGRLVSLRIPDEIRTDIGETDRCLLWEYAWYGRAPVRETDLYRS